MTITQTPYDIIEEKMAWTRREIHRRMVAATQGQSFTFDEIERLKIEVQNQVYSEMDSMEKTQPGRELWREDAENPEVKVWAEEEIRRLEGMINDWKADKERGYTNLRSSNKFGTALEDIDTVVARVEKIIERLRSGELLPGRF